MQKIRVLHIVSGIAIGDQSGGAESFALRLACHLEKNRFMPAVFALWRFDSASESEWIKRLDREQIALGGLSPHHPNDFTDFQQNLSVLWRFVSDFKPQIINSHSDRGDFLNAIIKLVHPIHPKAIRTVHIDHFWKTHPTFKILVNQVLFPLTFDLNIAVSSSIRQIIDSRPVSRLFNNKSVLVYNGIDTELVNNPRSIKEKLSAIHDIPNKRPLIGIIGRLTEQKGHADLIKALHLVRKTMPAYLLIIGSGALENDLRHLVREYDLLENVYFLGSRRDVLDILPCLDLVVSSSLWEGFPTVLLEAMTLGVPVVATEVSGSKELVHNNVTGLIVDVKNPAKLAEAIIFMLSNTGEAQAMALRAKNAVSQFTIQNVADQYSAIYSEMIQ